jgi:hypothetical protein
MIAQNLLFFCLFAGSPVKGEWLTHQHTPGGFYQRPTMGWMTTGGPITPSSLENLGGKATPNSSHHACVEVVLLAAPFLRRSLAACVNGGGLVLEFVDAMMHNNLVAVREIISRVDFDLHSTGPNGEHYLGVAIALANIELAGLLIRRGSNVRLLADGYGLPSDMAAAFGCCVEMREFLLSRENCKNVRCRGVGAKKCQGCKLARYCGRGCQRADWRAHKAACLQMRRANRFREWAEPRPTGSDDMQALVGDAIAFLESQ